MVLCEAAYDQQLLFGVKIITPARLFHKATCTIGLNSMNLDPDETARTLLEYPCGNMTEGTVTGIVVGCGRVFWGDSTSSAVMMAQLHDGGFASTAEVLVDGLNEPQGLALDEASCTLAYIDSGEHYGTGITSIKLVRSVADANANARAELALGNFSSTGIPRGLFLANETLFIAADSTIARVSVGGSEGSEPPKILATSVPDDASPGLLGQGIAVVGQELFFSRFYGGLYSVDLGSSGAVAKVANSTYGTYGLAYGAETLFFTAMSSLPISPGGDVMAVTLGSEFEGSDPRKVCSNCASGAPALTTAIRHVRQSDLLKLR